MASPPNPSPSQPLPRQQQRHEEKPPKSAAAPSSSASFLSSFADRWRAYSGSGSGAGSATAASPSAKPNSSASASAPSAATKEEKAKNRTPATHLCVLVHGLWGRPSDWDVVAERLDLHKRTLEGREEAESSFSSSSPEHLRVLKSRANARRLTLDGIDVCASRLADEVRAAVAEERERFGAEARLERVSFVGHSMGGLIARAAVAELLDKGDEAKPEKTTTTTLAGGLSPAHFVSVATPHLGCHAEAEATVAFVAAARGAAAAVGAGAAAGENQETKEQQLRQHPALIPLVSWIAGASPASSSTVAPRLLAAAAARASASMGRSGPQFFLTDGGGKGKEGTEGGEEGQGLPLLARLADPSLPAMRALRAFESRTTFANSSGDHLVGWSNASLRDPRELPRAELQKAARAAAEAVTATAAANDGGGNSWSSRLFFSRRKRSAVVAKEGGVGVVLEDGVAAAFEHKDGGKKRDERERERAAEEEEELVDKMLAALSSLPWRRVDACFRGTPTPFLAHNHIQATHFFNEKVGRASADAIARAVVEADEELLRRRRRRRKEEGKERG